MKYILKSKITIHAFAEVEANTKDEAFRLGYGVPLVIEANTDLKNQWVFDESKEAEIGTIDVIDDEFDMTNYRLFNHITGRDIYLMSISNDPNINHEERLEKKKQEASYSKEILYENMSWETTK